MLVCIFANVGGPCIAAVVCSCDKLERYTGEEQLIRAAFQFSGGQLLSGFSRGSKFLAQTDSAVTIAACLSTSSERTGLPCSACASFCDQNVPSWRLLLAVLADAIGLTHHADLEKYVAHITDHINKTSESYTARDIILTPDAKSLAVAPDEPLQRALSAMMRATLETHPDYWNMAAQSVFKATEPIMPAMSVLMNISPRPVVARQTLSRPIQAAKISGDPHRDSVLQIEYVDRMSRFLLKSEVDAEAKPTSCYDFRFRLGLPASFVEEAAHVCCAPVACMPGSVLAWASARELAAGIPLNELVPVTELQWTRAHSSLVMAAESAAKAVDRFRQCLVQASSFATDGSKIVPYGVNPSSAVLSVDSAGDLASPSSAVMFDGFDAGFNLGLHLERLSAPLSGPSSARSDDLELTSRSDVSAAIVPTSQHTTPGTACRTLEPKPALPVQPKPHAPDRKDGQGRAPRRGRKLKIVTSQVDGPSASKPSMMYLSSSSEELPI